MKIIQLSTEIEAYQVEIQDGDNTLTMPTDAKGMRMFELAFKAGAASVGQGEAMTEKRATELAAYFQKECLSRTSYKIEPYVYKAHRGLWRLRIYRPDGGAQENINGHESMRHTFMLLACFADEQYEAGILEGRKQALDKLTRKAAETLCLSFKEIEYRS